SHLLLRCGRFNVLSLIGPLLWQLPSGLRNRGGRGSWSLILRLQRHQLLLLLLWWILKVLRLLLIGLLLILLLRNWRENIVGWCGERQIGHIFVSMPELL